MAKLPCPPELWPEFSRLLFVALDLPIGERGAWLQALAPEHAPLRPWLARVLDVAATQDPPSFLHAPTIASGSISELSAGERIGPYLLERELGRGGMGEVWLAMRSDGVLNRQVALKLPHPHLLSGALRARFERERDILAALSHAHIAQIYDAGISDSGRPYLAMEWIDGTPITRYCNDVRLPIAGRLELFRQVLDAVNYANTRFIAHRDLKPSNILVDPDGQAKLLDFGIAKLLSDDAAGLATELTQLSGRAITPGYAAPEQIAGQPITTAVDLYALGVVLFELLVGARPFDAASAATADARDAPLASQRTSDTAAAQVGGISGAQLRKLLRGDLDAIIAKALEADPARRYRSAEAFASDLDRYRKHEPISARRIGRLALIAKFTRRHRVATALAASLIATLLVGAGGIAWQAVRAQREAERAEREAARAQNEAQNAQNEAKREKATKDFLVGVFKASDPRVASDKPRGTITAKELLDVSSDRIEKQFASDPDTQIELLGIAADIYGNFGESERYQALLEKQVDLARVRYGESSPVVIKAIISQANLADTRSDYATALKLLDQADGLITRAGLNQSRERAAWWLIRGDALTADAASRRKRIDALENAAKLYAAVAPDDPDYPTAISDLAGAYFTQGDYAHSEELSLRAITVQSNVHAGEQGDLIGLYGNLALTLTYEGAFDRAEQAHQRAVELARTTFGVRSLEYWQATGGYAQAVHLRGDRERAQKLFADLLALIPDMSERFPNAIFQNGAARVHEVFGDCLLAEGRPQAAISELQAAERGYAAAPVYFYDLSQVHGTLGAAYDRVGNAQAAEPLLKSALDDYLANWPPDDPSVLKHRQAWGSFLLTHGRAAEARLQFQEILAQAHDRNLSPVALTHADLARFALTTHDVAAALESSSRAVEVFDNVVGFRDVRMGPYLWRIRAEALLLSGDAKGAREWAQRALDADRRYDDPRSDELARAVATLKRTQLALAPAR